MSEKPNKEDVNRIMFANLIMMFSASAMQQMGKTINPFTKKIEVDMDGAQMTIDMISMLQAKTKDNCDATEKKMINDILSALQLNFVETSNSQASKKDDDKDAPPPKSEEEPNKSDKK